MTELSPKARELIARGRTAHDPKPADFTRTHAAFTAALASLETAAPGSSEPAIDAPSALTAGKSGSLFGLSKVVGLCTLALAGGLTLNALRGERSAANTPKPAVSAQILPAPEPVQAAALPPPAPVGGLAPPGAEGAESTAIAQPEPSHVLRAIPDPGAARVLAGRSSRSLRPRAGSADRPRPAAMANQAAPSEAARSDALVEDPQVPAVAGDAAPRGVSAEELALLRSAVNTLAGGRAEEALQLIESHRARYPGSALDQERRGLQVLSLCALGQFERGFREQRAFLASEGSSPLARRVRAACAPGQAPNRDGRP